MRRREYHWSLFHRPEKNQIDSLRTDQVEAIFAAVPKAQRKEWFIWKEGFDGWKSFDDFPQLVLSLRKADDRILEPPPPFEGEAKTVVQTPAKPAPQRTDEIKKEQGPHGKLVIDGDSGQDELSLMRAGVLEDRNNMRFDKAIEVRIYVNDQVFKNTTLNISLKGMQLKEALPSTLPRYFNVEIGKGEKTIPVVCSEVKSKGQEASTRLKIESNEHASALLTMLLSGS